MNNPVKEHRAGTQRNWLIIPAIGYLLLMLFLALFADWLPLPYSPTAPDLTVKLQEPFQWHLFQSTKPFHWLGTDGVGRDLLAIMVYGTRTAFLVSIPAMILAVVVGVGLGIMAGYYADSGFAWPVARLGAFIFSGLFFFYYAFGSGINLLPGQAGYVGPFLQIVTVAVLTYLLFKLLSFLLIKVPFFRRPVKLPLDLLVLKVIELIGAVPRLLLILCLAAFLPPSLVIVVLLSMFTFWPGIARLTRAEILKLKKLPYIEAAVTLGFTPTRVLLRHALPNMLVPILVAVTFGICNLIALESTLSFLGVGVPVNMPSWGRAINGFWLNPQAWWLLLFPGLNIMLVVLALQNVNNHIIYLLHPRKP
jgi:peptide/nickel transport system permease protein